MRKRIKIGKDTKEKKEEGRKGKENIGYGDGISSELET